ncbi:MAG: serine/threonine-protein kinase [Polyangiales bacterium]
MGRVLDERYEVDRVVARGGFGVVYQARHRALGVPVALKVLDVPANLRGAEQKLIERFLREAQTLASLSHPAIVRALDVGTLGEADGGHVWMALEWLDGVTLADDLAAREGRPRSPAETLALLGPVFDALTCTHARGIAHRDLKPGNIMLVASTSGAPTARVLDFGIAKEFRPDEEPGTGSTETHGDFSAFSLDHAAPEQVGRARTGPWTDVHALALLVTELLVGRRPYAGEESFDLFAAVMSPERPSPARFELDVGPWEVELRNALALKPSARHADAGALHRALAATVNDAQIAWERTSAPPPPASDASAPTVAASASAPRRKPGALVAVAVALLALVGGVALVGLTSSSPLAQRAGADASVHRFVAVASAVGASPTLTPRAPAGTPSSMAPDALTQAPPAPTPPALPSRARAARGARTRGPALPEVVME